MSAPVPILCRRRFLDGSILARVLPAVRALPGEAAAIQPAPGATLAVVEEVRRAWEVELPDALHTDLLLRIEGLRTELERRFAVRLEPCDAVAALRYPPGAFYRTHRDVSADPDLHDLHRRAVSIVIFLNSAEPRPDADFSGGTLRFHHPETADDVLDVVPEAGMLVAFRSDLLHEVTPVVSGTRATVVAWLVAADEPDAPPAPPLGPPPG